MKYKKAIKKLETRIKDYNETVKRDPNAGRGYSKPGSMSGRK